MHKIISNYNILCAMVLYVERVGKKSSLFYFRSKTFDSLSTGIKNSNMLSLLVRQEHLFFSFACVLELISFNVTFTNFEPMCRAVASSHYFLWVTMTKTFIFCFSVN